MELHQHPHIGTRFAIRTALGSIIVSPLHIELNRARWTCLGFGQILDAHGFWYSDGTRAVFATSEAHSMRETLERALRSAGRKG